MEKSSITLSLRSIFVNFSHLAFGEFASKAFGFLTMIYLARILGADGFGFYGFISVVSVYVILFSNFGIEQYSTQQLSTHDQVNVGTAVTTVVFTRLFLSFVFLIPYLLFGALYSANSTEFSLFVIQSILIISFAINVQFYLVAAKKIRLIAIIKIMITILVLLATVLFVKTISDLNIAIFINGSVSFIVFAGTILYIYSGTGQKISIPAWATMAELIKKALPLGISAFMIQIYHSVDIIILGFSNPGLELGYYTGAYRIINVLSIIPGMMYVIFLPYLSKITSKYFNSSVTKKYITILVILGFLLSSSCIFFSEDILLFLLGDQYLPALTVLRILFINLFFIFINVSLAHLFISWNQHKTYLVIVSVGAIINIIFNFLLIPQYGIIGAAIATVCAELAVLICAVWYHHRLHNLFTTRVMLS